MRHSRLVSLLILASAALSARAVVYPKGPFAGDVSEDFSNVTVTEVGDSFYRYAAATVLDGRGTIYGNLNGSGGSPYWKGNVFGDPITFQDFTLTGGDVYAFGGYFAAYEGTTDPDRNTLEEITLAVYTEAGGWGSVTSSTMSHNAQGVWLGLSTVPSGYGSPNGWSSDLSITRVAVGFRSSRQGPYFQDNAAMYFRSLQLGIVPSPTPGPAAALPFALMALRRRKAGK